MRFLQADLLLHLLALHLLALLLVHSGVLGLARGGALRLRHGLTLVLEYRCQAGRDNVVAVVDGLEASHIL